VNAIVPSRPRWVCNLLAGTALVLIASSSYAAPTRLRLNGSAGLGYDSNIGASQDNVEKEDSAFYSLLLAADYLLPFAGRFALTVRGQVQGDAFERFDDLSNARALGLLRLAYKPGSHFFSPTLSTWISGAHLEYGSEIRTGNETRGGLFVTQPLTTALSIRAELKGFHREAEGRVFDVSGQAAALSLNWMLSPVFSTSAGFEYQTGDATSSAAPSARIAQAAEEIEPDDAFGGIDGNQFAYRIDARTRIASAGFNWRLSRDWALDAQLQSVSVDGDFGNQYDRLIGVVGILVRF
jgi:hypothetical protein